MTKKFLGQLFRACAIIGGIAAAIFIILYSAFYGKAFDGETIIRITSTKTYDEVVEQICTEINDGGNIVVAANYNCPGQVVISGSVEGVNKACEMLKAAGAKRALPLSVSGAFHSPLMQPAKEELEVAIMETPFSTPRCPVYQNVTALPSTDPEVIKTNLLAQLTSPVRWTQSVKNMIADGASDFVECGPGKVLQGLVSKIGGATVSQLSL